MQNSSTNKILKSLEQYYLESKFDEGIDLLIENKKKFDTGLFHFNLGTLYLKKDNLPIARFHLEKSIKNGFVTNTSLNNLAYTKEKLQDSGVREDFSFVIGTKEYFAMFPIEVYLSITLFLGIILLYFTKKTKKFIALSVLIAALPLSVYYYVHNSDTYAVALKDLPVYEGPSKIFQESNLVQPGTKLIIKVSKNKWAFINEPEYLRGWIEFKNIGVYE